MDRDDEEKLLEEGDSDIDLDSDEAELQLGLMGVAQKVFLQKQIYDMGFERNVVEALMNNAKENLDTVDQAIEVMYDPTRHRFFAGDLADELVSKFNRREAACAICNFPAADHRVEELRRASII